MREWNAQRLVMLSELYALKADIDQGLADLAAARVKFFDANRIITQGKQLSRTLMT